jgi:hypothetical protein
MKLLRAAFALLAFAAPFLAPPAGAENHKIDPDRYGALVYSPKTGKYGYSWNHTTREAAEKAALAECKEPDAKVLTWVKFGWAALVIAEDNAYGYDEVHGDGVTDADAEKKAVKHLRQQTDAKVKTVVIVCSGDVKPKVIKK